MRGTFGDRTRDLERRVGSGRLTGSVVVDQRYAQRQHEEVGWSHQPGRIPKYLERPLLGNADRYMRHLADTVLDGDLTEAMADNMRHLVGEVEHLAPIDENDLPRSGHAQVHDQGRLVFDQPPKVHRLSDAELRAKAARRGRGGFG